MAFLLATAARLVSSGLSLLWTRWLLQAMGDQAYGIFISFQALISLGTMGDLGLGGTVGIETNRLLGAGRTSDLKEFLAATRTVFLILGVATASSFALASPWLAPALGFSTDKPASTLLMFAVGAVTICATVICSFTAGLSNACQNLTWPILPSLFITQVTIASHLWLARGGAALWLQLAPYAAAAVMMAVLYWTFVRISHPEFSLLRPVRVKWSQALHLFSQSFWVYLWSFGYLVYITTDRLVINRYFGPALASVYYVNYKPAELAMFLLVTLTFVSLTKIIQWHCSPISGDKERAVEAALKLQSIEIFLGVSASLLYLAFNERFVALWLGSGHEIPLFLQALFAANLGVSVSGDAGTKIAGQINARGTVFAGAMVGLTGLLNLGLSILAGRAGFLSGIAAATLVAQLFFGITTGYFAAGALGLSRARWIFRGSVFPLLAIIPVFVLRDWHKVPTFASALWLGLALLLTVIGCGVIVGIDRKLVLEEWSILRSMLKN